MKLKGVLLFLALFCIANVSAGTLDMKIYTLSNHTLNINFLNSEMRMQSYGAMTEKTGADGELDLSFDNSAASFDIDIFLMKDSETVVYESFPEILNNQEVIIYFTPALASIEKAEQESSSNNKTNSENSTEINKAIDLSENSTKEINESAESEIVENTSNEKSSEKKSNKSISARSVTDMSKNRSTNSSSLYSMINFDKKSLFYFGAGIGIFIVLIMGSAITTKYIRTRRRAKNNSSFGNMSNASLEDVQKKMEDVQKELLELKQGADTKAISSTKEESSKKENKKDLELEKELKAAKRRLRKDRKKLAKLKKQKEKEKKD